MLTSIIFSSLSLLILHVTLGASLDEKPAFHTGDFLVPTVSAPISLGKLNNKTYYASNMRASWVDSLEYCHSNNLSLVSTVTQAELDFVGQKLRQHRNWLYPWFWTCGNDFFEEGEYKWMRHDYPINSRFLTTKFSPGPAIKRNCIQLSIRAANRTVLFDFNCDDTTSLPLCEGG